MKILKVTNYRNCDTYYIPLDDTDNTWREVLDYIESVLDDQFCKLKTMVGCKIDATIVEMTQAEVDELDIDE